MRSSVEDISSLIHSGSQQIVSALQRASAEGLDSHQLTDLLQTAFSERNRIDAALTSTIGALDSAVEAAPGGELTLALSCATWLSHNLPISSSSAHAQVRIARQLFPPPCGEGQGGGDGCLPFPALPSTTQAFRRG